VLTLDDVSAAAERIRRYVVRTPMEPSAGLSERCGVDVWLKFECFQYTGSFKLRGALNALMLLPEEAKRKGVVTASAGNHGLGVARAAELLGVPATVVVPETASQAKVDALQQSSARLVLHGPTYDEAEAEAVRLAATHGLRYVSAYNDPAVVAGAGTLALEILEDLPTTATLIVPAGGGGLISGIGIAAHGLNPNISIIGVQSVASPALRAALDAGKVVRVDVGSSLADGLSGNVEKDTITLDLIKQHVRRIALVEEAQIADAVRWMLEEEHVLVEGSAAVGVAMLQTRAQQVSGPVCVLLTGRNIAAAVLQRVLAR
jgi:threonine dehydratase